MADGPSMSVTARTPALKDPLENLLGYQLRRAAFVMMTSLADGYSRLGLNATEAVFMRFVQANPGCSQSEVGRALGVKRTNLVPIVSGLIARELLQRAAADGRSHSLHLSGKGRELCRKIVRLSQKNEQYFFGDISDDTKRILMQALLAVRRKGEADT